MAKQRMAEQRAKGNKSRRRFILGVRERRGDDPVADWERWRVIALKEECPRTTLMRRSSVANGQVFRCGETLRQRRNRCTENRTHHVGTVPAV